MFLLSQNDENQSENGSKNSKIRLRARPPAEPQKKMLQTKKLRSKSWKTQGFFTFRLPILDGRVHEQVSSVLFFTVFFEGERHDLSKTGGFGRKMPPPPGKPVTFYECHPDDHAPAPSVRADLMVPEVEHSSEAGGVVEPTRLLGPSSAMDRNIPWRRTWRWFWIPRRIPRGFGAPKTREGFTWEIPQFLEGSKQQHKIEWCRAAGSREFWMMVIWYL